MGGRRVYGREESLSITVFAAAASRWRLVGCGATLLLGLPGCPQVCLVGLLRRDESHLDQEGKPPGRALDQAVGGVASGHGCGPFGARGVLGEPSIENTRRDNVGPLAQKAVKSRLEQAPKNLLEMDKVGPYGGGPGTPRLRLMGGPSMGWGDTLTVAGNPYPN